MRQTLRWRSLEGWMPKEGTWALLWPGYYGPFAACWMRGRWTMCEDSDFRHAKVGAPITIPHLTTDAIPEWDRLQSFHEEAQQ
jgi:hypothetical protein